MGTETERKFLVLDDSWKDGVVASYDVTQGYISKDKNSTVRIRTKGDKGFVTIKGQAPADRPLDTPEFEYEIPHQDALDLLKLCLPGAITKTRHIVEHAGHTWEIDVFGGLNAGLTVAEIELKNADEKFEKPSWLGEEVSFDHRYKNTALSEIPFSAWQKTESSVVKKDAKGPSHS